MINSNGKDDPAEKYEYSPLLKNRLGGKRYIFISIISLIVILLVSVIFAVFSQSSGRTTNPVKDAVGWEVLRIDGNRNNNYVNFDHESHKGIAGQGREGCRTCHHLSRPHDGPSSCYQCHTDMENPVSIFDHDYHLKLNAKNNSCRNCHILNNGSEQEVIPCSSCHNEYLKDVKYYLSVRSYKSAMHTTCIGCHENEDNKAGEKIFSDCGVCHGVGND